MYNMKDLFKIADSDLNVNTSYPVYQECFKEYKSDSDIFKNVRKLSFYIHIPFCKQLCKFCEYTRFLADNEEMEEKYLVLLGKQINEFVETHEIDMIYGFDVGGGTPSSLSDKNFEKMINLQYNLENKYKKVHDFEKSIEISFSTINENKIQIISDAGFNRISAGMQSIDKKLMIENNRYYTEIDKILKIKNLISNSNIKKLNIDLMYGLPNQTDDIIYSTIEALNIINPEQVTLYETRYNQNNINSFKISRELQYKQYSIFYNELIKAGYVSHFGKNTFTKTNDDGVSSYLKYRMEKCIPYKGFGISAQSMSLNGLSYNILKNTKEKNMPDISEIKEYDNYVLPPREISAKYVSIAMYNGKFSKHVLDNILNKDSLEYFKDEFDYLFNNNYITLQDDDFILTAGGFRYYGAISSLFWSDKQKQRLLIEGKL